MRTYNEIVDDLESLEKKEATDVSGLDTRVTVLEESLGTKLYKHIINFKITSLAVGIAIIINKSNAQIDSYDKLVNELKTMNIIGFSNPYTASGAYSSGTIVAIAVSATNKILLATSGTGSYDWNEVSLFNSIADNVITL